MNVKDLHFLLPKKHQHLYISNDEINAVSVFENKRLDLAGVAKTLVSERHEKADLEKLVFYLLCKLEDSNDKISELNDVLYENALEMDRLCDD